ncbi:FecCD family ABC transporter permease [Aliidiomarina haloalkalitolerans]|uniref:ABC transporter permease n=1 Tax=Aliidiomarina haloalkalitolerans TaxID=859059 RepID=A0A432VQQ3_9GAMM|nr:iron ABC transporter permease [Aliidiomarina haloalkalitolerans]RUO18596.1 ABC transporter permease [Aliidiomarina haloalkalitolerans]
MTPIFYHRLLLLVALLILLAIGLNFGGSSIQLRDLFASDESADLARLILLEVRLPRLLLAALVGAALGMSGAAIQGLLRNPLAEPGILGISSGGAAMAVIALYLGFAGWGFTGWGFSGWGFAGAGPSGAGGSGLNAWLLPLFAITGSGLALAVIVWIARMNRSKVTIILAGVAISAFCSGLIALVLSLSPNPFAFQEISYWLLGSLNGRDLGHVVLMLPGLLIGGWLLLTTRRYLMSLTLGEDVAHTLGFSNQHWRTRVLVGVAIATGSAVALTGIIGFVGLIIPHLVRPLVRGRPDYLLVSSALAGAVFLLGLDILVQLLPTGPEIQVGALAAIIGGPFFLYLLLTNLLKGDVWRS